MRVCPSCGSESPSSHRFCPACGAALQTSAETPLAGAPAGSSGRKNHYRTGVVEVLPEGTLLNGRYRVIRVLGSGSFGRVYLAEDNQEPGTLVAVKELLAMEFPTPEEQRDAVAWFKREVSTLLTLDHPGIPAMLGYWTANRTAGPLYLAMDYIPGKTLAEVQFEAGGQLPRIQVLHLGIGLCSVLEYLHSRTPPFVFRDLKPANVLIDRRNQRPVLIDFGLARQMAPTAATAVGTWGYVPFEQVLGRPEPRSDLYALGAMLHSLLTGRQPDAEYRHLMRSGLDLQTSLSNLFPPVDDLLPGVPSGLVDLLLRATAFAPEDRFPDAASFGAALRDVLQHPGGLPMSGPLVASPEPSPARQQAPAQPSSGRAGSGGRTAISADQDAAAVEKPATWAAPEAAQLAARQGGHANAPPTPVLLPLDTAALETMPALEPLPDKPAAAPIPPAGVQLSDAPPSAAAAASAPDTEANGAFRGDAALPAEPGRRGGRWPFKRPPEAEAPPPAVPTAAAPASLTVSVLGNGDTTTIGEALRRAAPGARIVVESGVYAESLVLDKQVEIVGSGRSGEVIVESDAASCVLMQTERAVLRNLTLRCHSSRSGTGFYTVTIPAGQLLIEDCHLVSHSLACVAIHGAGARPVLRRCTLRNSVERALTTYDKAQAVVEECDIQGGTHPVRITAGAHPLFRRCRIHQGRFGGVWVAERGAGTFEHCDIVDNGHHGVAVRQDSRAVLKHCSIQRNGWCAVSVTDTSGAQVSQCDLTGNRRGAWDVRDSARPNVKSADNQEI